MQIKIIDHLERFDEVAVNRLIEQLPTWRKEMALKFRHFEGKRESALAYHALCQLLREKFDIDCQPTFAIGEHGKPTLMEFPHLNFSLSHCKEAVGCLIDEHPCGLDIEHIRPVNESLIRYTMNEDEVKKIMEARCPEKVFTELWTRKEAVGKLRGVGIGEDLHKALLPEALKGIELQTSFFDSYIVSTAIVSS